MNGERADELGVVCSKAGYGWQHWTSHSNQSKEYVAIDLSIDPNARGNFYEFASHRPGQVSPSLGKLSTTRTVVENRPQRSQNSASLYTTPATHAALVLQFLRKRRCIKEPLFSRSIKNRKLHTAKVHIQTDRQ
jgi:hypothetical protein